MGVLMGADIKLSKNFKQSEFKCSCCGMATVDLRLIKALEQLRELLGKPISITSGYRCKRHNAEIGGARSSKHQTGQAADIDEIYLNFVLYGAGGPNELNSHLVLEQGYGGLEGYIVRGNSEN
jgi:hypothetical protein